MYRIIPLIIALIVLIFPLSGCYDAYEVTDYAYVYSIGVDKGVTQRLRLTVQIQTAKGQTSSTQGSSGGSGSDNIDVQEKNGYLNVTIDSPTFYGALNLLNSFISREINYTHAKFFVVSEKMAREGINTYLNAAVRGRQFRRNAYVIISKESANKFLKEVTPTLGTSLSKYQQSIISETRDTGLFINSTYTDVLNDVKSYSGQPAIAYAGVNKYKNFSKARPGKYTKKVDPEGNYFAGQLVRKGGNKVEYMGSAIFNGNKMVGILDGEDTRAMLMLRGEFDKGIYNVTDPIMPKYAIILSIRRQRGNDVKVSLKRGKPNIDVTLNLEGDFAAIQSSVNYESLKLKPIAEKAIIKQIKKEVDDTIKKCQKLRVDVFKLGRYVQMHFLTIPEWEKFDWLKKFSSAKINTKINLVLRRSGTMVKTSPSLGAEGVQK